MTQELTALMLTAATIGVVHTLLGPDHYLPFVALARARNWTGFKMAWITAVCGLGHVLSSVVLGLIGVAIGTAVTRLEFIESVRGDLAAWALIAFGLVYTVWGIRRAGRRHSHRHALQDLQHDNKKSGSVSIWAIFLIFVLGPCEPLIPLLMYPAAKQSTAGMVWVAAVFSLTTITTMTALAVVLRQGVKKLRFGRLEHYSHAMAGLAITVCGVSIQLGL